MLAIAVSSLSCNAELWKKYFLDFVNIKCIKTGTLKSIPEDCLQILAAIISVYFGFNQQSDESDDRISLLAWVHVHSEVHKTDLAQTVDKFKRLIQHQPHESQKLSFTQSASLAVKDFRSEKDLGTLLIQQTYTSLSKIVNKGSINDLKQWYLTYRDTVSYDCLINIVHSLFYRVKSSLCFIHFMSWKITDFDSGFSKFTYYTH